MGAVSDFQAVSSGLGAEVRKALETAVEGLQEGAVPEGAAPSWRILAEIARGVADTADEYRRNKDGRGYLAAVRDLEGLLDELFPKGGTDGGRARRGGDGAPDDRSAELAGVLGSGPTLGDSA